MKNLQHELETNINLYPSYQVCISLHSYKKKESGI
jgi:hypothetical protein